MAGGGGKGAGSSSPLIKMLAMRLSLHVRSRAAAALLHGVIKSKSRPAAGTRARAAALSQAAAQGNGRCRSFDSLPQPPQQSFQPVKLKSVYPTTAAVLVPAVVKIVDEGREKKGDRVPKRV